LGGRRITRQLIQGYIPDRIQGVRDGEAVIGHKEPGGGKNLGMLGKERAGAHRTTLFDERENKKSRGGGSWSRGGGERESGRLFLLPESGRGRDGENGKKTGTHCANRDSGGVEGGHLGRSASIRGGQSHAGPNEDVVLRKGQFVSGVPFERNPAAAGEWEGVSLPERTKLNI